MNRRPEANWRRGRDAADPAVGRIVLDDVDLAAVEGGTATPVIPITIGATLAEGCFSVGNTVCNGTCAVGGTSGCCGG